MKRLLITVILLFLLMGSVSATITANTSYAGGYTTVTFTSNNVSGNLTDISTYVLATDATEVEWLVIGAGGAGANGHVGGGGGAGGFLTNEGNATTLTAGTYNISIGIGGRNATAGATYTGNQGNGTFSCFQNILAYGGGNGGNYDSGAGAQGGSGGGGAYTTGVGGTNVTGQGFPGGTATGTPAGGGGANTQNRTQVNTGTGGDGKVSGITGSAYAGGGAGGSLDAGNKTGGFGGGGRGGTNGGSFKVGEAGKANTGSGGGGGGNAPITVGGPGANGIVVLKFKPAAAPVLAASFNQTYTNGMTGLTVTFNSTSTGSPDSLNWSIYRTGSSPALPSATTLAYTRLFSDGGNYTINLTVTNGGTSTALGYVDIWNYTSGDFAANDTTGVMTLPVLFTPTVYNATTYNWSFGDGNVSAEASPTHTYNVLGVFDVKLYISNGHDNTWINKTGYITVSTTPVPAADFSGTPVTGVVPLNVTFTDSSTESPTEWNYTFGDGNYSHLQNPVYQYLSAGTYTVSLNATNAGGSNTNTKAAYITVSPMTASFAANDTSGTNPTAIQFTGSSTGVADTWYWEFGDGNTSVLQNPVFVYGVNGTFNVNMRATNLTSGAFDWENKTGYITITQVSNGYNQQDIELDPQFTLTVHITDSSSGAAIPVNTVTTSDGQMFTTTNGTAIFTEPYSTVVVYVSSDGYYSVSTSYVMDSDRTETVQLSKSADTSNTNLNQLYPHETTFTLIDRYGNRLDNVTITATMTSTTITGNWFETLFGLSDAVAPTINTSVMTGYSDDYGKVAFPMVSSAVYTMTFTDSRLLGGTTTKKVTPDQSAITLVLATTAGELPLVWGDYLNATLYTNSVADPTIYLNLSYNDTSLTTTNIIYYVQYPNYTYAYHVNMPATPSTNQSKVIGFPVQNVRGAAYVWGYYANSTFGNMSKNTGITFNGPNGGLLDLFGQHSGWE